MYAVLRHKVTGTIDSQPVQFTNSVNSSPIEKDISTSSDETASWRQYKNDIKGYSFKYPTNWTINDVAVCCTSIFSYDPQASDRPYSSSPTAKEIHIFIDAKNKETLARFHAVDDWAEIHGLTNRKSITVDGFKAVRGLFPIGDITGEYLVGSVLVMLDNNQGHEITYDPLDSELVSTFDIILSTLKFNN